MSSGRARAALLPGGARLHLQDGPIDLILCAFGTREAVQAAYRAAAALFDGVLDALCSELPALRTAAGLEAPPLRGAIARRMAAAVSPYADEHVITPMAAVAGAVAEAVLDAMVGSGGLARAYVNNGGDIALHCRPGERLTVGLVDRPDRPQLFGEVVVRGDEPIRGIATSGWRGRSFSLGIADSVTVLARTAAEADAAATVIANAVDLPGHPAVRRLPANSLQPDSDLGDRLVTRDVGPLAAFDIGTALGSGLACAEDLCRRGLVLSAALQLQGRVRITGAFPEASVARPVEHPAARKRGGGAASTLALVAARPEARQAG